MTIKKAFLAVHALLMDNQNKLVSDIQDELTALMSAKVNTGKSVAPMYVKDTKGKVVAIHDYYYKRWLPLVGDNAVKFGIKQNTKTGYNRMCKSGAALWRAQLSKAKIMREDFLFNCSDAKFIDEYCKTHKSFAEYSLEVNKAINETRSLIEKTEDYNKGFDTLDEVNAYLGL